MNIQFYKKKISALQKERDELRSMLENGGANELKELKKECKVLKTALTKAEKKLAKLENKG